MKRISLLLGGILGLITVPARADDLVIDDGRMSKDFSHKLGAMVDRGESMDGAEGGRLLKEADGKTIAAPAQPAPSVIPPGESVYTHCRQAVVAIGSVYKCGKCNDWHLGGFATGWILSPDGLIFTNYHVLEKEDHNTVGVMTADGEVFAVKEILAAKKAGDAAIFRIDTRGKSLPYLKLAVSALPGDPVTIISHPKGRFYCLSEGVISRFHRRTNQEDQSAVWMSVTADYAVGSSGGPVFNPAGEVVGMVSSTMAATATEDQKATQGTDLQMVFRDCVSLATMRGMLLTP